MKTLSEELARYQNFLAKRGNSNYVKRVYTNRIRSFLEANPEVMKANAIMLKVSVSSYIDGLPVNSGKGVTSTAVRFYWSYKSGEPLNNHYRQSDYITNVSFDDEVASFSRYLKGIGMNDQRILELANKVKRFLYSVFSGKYFTRDLITVEVIRDYLSITVAYLSPGTKSGVAGCMREYAKFLSTVGYEKNATAILRLPTASYVGHDGRLPGCISDENYRHLIESFDPSSERGARDRAIALCMGNLGLRRSDVSKLSLDDINWMEGTLTVRSSKSISIRRIPLDAETGAALEVYVTSFRPKNVGGQLFYATGGEKGGGAVAPGQVGGAILLAAEKAGLADYHGTHTLRRSVATRMINEGVDIKTIADVLGHEQITTTMRYLRIGLAKLRKVSGQWPEEVRHA